MGDVARVGSGQTEQAQQVLDRVVEVCRDIREDVAMAEWPSTRRKATKMARRAEDRAAA